MPACRGPTAVERLLKASLLLVPKWDARLLVPPLLEGLPAAGMSWLALEYKLARAAEEVLGLLPPERVDRPKGFSEVGLEVRKLASLQDSKGCMGWGATRTGSRED